MTLAVALTLASYALARLLEHIAYEVWPERWGIDPDAS